MKVEYARRMRRKLTANKISKAQASGMNNSRLAASPFDRLNDQADFDTLLSVELKSNSNGRSASGFQLAVNENLEHDVKALNNNRMPEKPRLLNEIA